MGGGGQFFFWKKWLGGDGLPKKWGGGDGLPKKWGGRDARPKAVRNRTPPLRVFLAPSLKIKGTMVLMSSQKPQVSN